MLTFGSPRAHLATKADINLLPTEAEVEQATIAHTLVTRAPPNQRAGSVVGMLQSLEAKITALSSNSLATKQDVQNMMTAINEVAQYNENGHILTEVQLQTNSPFAYLAVCGSNGVVHKLLEGQHRRLPAEEANELLTPFSLYLDGRYRWTIVAIGLYQELNFNNGTRGLIVDGVPLAQSVGAYNYLLPESLENSNAPPEIGNRWVLGWG